MKKLLFMISVVILLGGGSVNIVLAAGVNIVRTDTIVDNHVEEVGNDDVTFLKFSLSNNESSDVHLEALSMQFYTGSGSSSLSSFIVALFEGDAQSGGSQQVGSAVSPSNDGLLTIPSLSVEISPGQTKFFEIVVDGGNGLAVRSAITNLDIANIATGDPVSIYENGIVLGVGHVDTTGDGDCADSDQTSLGITGQGTSDNYLCGAQIGFGGTASGSGTVYSGSGTVYITTNSGEVRTGGSAPTIDVVSVYDKKSIYNKCINIYPIRDKLLSTDTIYKAYRTCKTNGRLGRYGCAGEWAKAQGYSLCTERALDAVRERTRLNPSEIIETEKRLKTDRQQQYSQSNQCQYISTNWEEGVEFSDTSVSPFYDLEVNDTAYWPMIVLSERGIISGRVDNVAYTDSEELINRAEVSKILVVANKWQLPNVCKKSMFMDTKDDQWFTPYIKALAEREIVEGNTQGLFIPAQNVTYGEFAKMLTKTFELGSFGEGDHWATEYINVLVNKNLLPDSIDGETNFDRELTRGEVSEMVFRTLEIIENNTDRF